MLEPQRSVFSPLIGAFLLYIHTMNYEEWRYYEIFYANGNVFRSQLLGNTYLIMLN